MERSVLGSEFKGGIWHRFFMAVDKKDETLRSILDEKIRFYKLYYPFLEKKQVIGKAYEELGIPHICGDVNRKELYKLFLKERRKKEAFARKKCGKSQDNSQKYPTLLIKENNTRKKCTFKMVTLHSKIKQTQVKINNVQSSTEKSTHDLAFDKLLFESPNPGKSNMKEGTVQNKHFKQPKSVRFNDGIEIHRVTPAQPMYKLKPLGRLFDEPSSVRTLNTQPNHHQEDMTDSDSEFDADTGIMSDTEEYDLQDASQTKRVPVEEQVIQDSEGIKHINSEEICLKKSITSTIYNSSEEFSSTDSDTAKEGNSLILSSKMITVAQGKWVRKAEQIIVNSNPTNNFEISNISENTYQDYEMETAEIHINRNDSIDEYMLEMIKYLKISPENENKNSEDCDNNEQITKKIKKDNSIIKNVISEARKKIDNKDLTWINTSVISDKKSIYMKSKNSKLSLENDFNKKLSNEELLTFDSNKLCNDFNEEVNNSNIHNENKTEKGKSDKLVLDKSSFINDYNSTNGNATKFKAKKIKTAAQEKVIHNTKCDASEELYSQNSLNDINSHMEENSSLQSVSNTVTQLKNVPDQSCMERIHMPDEIKPNIRPSYENKIKNEAQFSSLTEKLIDKGNFITQNPIYLDTLLAIKNEDLKQKELEIIHMSPTPIRSTENIQSNTDLKGLYSNIYSFTTSPIKVQVNEPNEDNNQDSHKNCNFSAESYQLKEQSKNIPACLMVSKYIMYNANNNFKSHHEKVEKADFINQIMNTKDKKTDDKVLVGENKLLSKSNSKEVMKGKSIDDPQSFRSSLIKKTLMSSLKPSAISPQGRHNIYEDDDDTFQAFISDQNLQCDETKNNELEATDFYQGTFAIKREHQSLDYLSKVHMWSLYSKDYTENLTTPSEVTTIKTTYNIDLSQREITPTSEKDPNDSCHQNCELETHLASKDKKFSKTFEDTQFNVGESSSESVSKKIVETGSSFGTVTPIKIQHEDSDAVSTAYETDSETGKLRMNHYFTPMAGSTPVRKPKGMYKEHFIGNKSDEKNNRSGELSSNISFDCVDKNPNKGYIREVEDNSSGFKVETKSNELSHALDAESALKSETLGHSQNKYNYEYLLPNVSLNISITSEDFKNVEMSVKTNEKAIKSLERRNVIKRRESDNVSHSIEGKYFKDFDSTSKLTASTTYYQDDNNKTNESIIESSDPNGIGKLKNEKIIENLESVIYINTQDDEYNKTDNKNLIETSGSMVCNKFDNQKHIETTTIISETATSNTEQTICFNKTNNESITQNSDPKTSHKKVTLKLLATEEPTFNIKDQNISPNKTSNQDIAHDSTSEFINGKYVNISSVIGKFNSKNTNQDQCNNLSSKSIIENSNPNSSCDFTAREYMQNLSASSDQIICNQLDSDHEINAKLTKSYGFKNNDIIKTMPLLQNFKEEQINYPLSRNFSNFSTRDNYYTEPKKSKTLPHKPLENKTIQHSFVNSHITSIIKKSCLQKDFDNEGSALSQVMDPCPNNENIQSTKSQNNLNTKSNAIISLVPATVKNESCHDDKPGENSDRSLKFQDLKHSTTLDYTDAGVLNSDRDLCSTTSNFFQQKCNKRIKSYSSNLKKKPRTSYDSINNYNNSLFSENENLELEKNVSPISSISVQSTGSHNSESSTPTGTCFLKMNLKRVNSNIRKKRAKLIKQNPMKRDSTSSEDDVKISPLPLKRKRFGINLQSVENSHDSQTIINLPKESVGTGYSHVKVKSAQQKMGGGLTDEDGERVSTILSVSFENEAHNRSGLKAFNKQPAPEDMKINEPQEIELDQSLEIAEQNQEDHKKYDKKATLSFSSPQANFLFSDDLKCSKTPFVSKKENISDNSKDQAVTNPIKKSIIYKKSHLSNQLLIGLPLSVKTTQNDSLMKQSAYDISQKKFNNKNNSSDLSESSSSMIGPSPNTERGLYNIVHKADVTASILNETKSEESYLSQKDISKTKKMVYDKPKNLVNWMMNTKQLREKDKPFSDKFGSENKTSELFHNNSYWTNNKDDEDNNKENHGCKRNNNSHCGSGKKISRTPVGILTDRSNNEVDDNKPMATDADVEEENLPFRRKVKNTKSSVVSWKGTNETDGLTNSPEVRTLLRRTYFMGNKN